MKRKNITAVIAAFAAGSTYAASDFIDTAQVVSSTPIYERVAEPRQECYTETPAAPQKPQERGIAAPILGGLAGALLGRQVGRGNGKSVATAVGAAVGTLAGDYAANPNADRSYTGAAVGAVAGGLLGSQIGSGSGNGAATAVGTIAGAMIGDRVGTQQTASAQPGQRCRTVESSREVIRGYNVVYRYNGRDITTTLPYNPGNSVKVSVGIVNDGAADSGRDYNRNGPLPVSSADTSTPTYNGNYNYRY